MTDKLESPYGTIRDRLQTDPLATIQLRTVLKSVENLETSGILSFWDMISALKTLIIFFRSCANNARFIPEYSDLNPSVLFEPDELISPEHIGWRHEKKTSVPFSGLNPLEHQSELSRKISKMGKKLDPREIMFALDDLYQEIDSFWQSRYNITAKLTARQMQEFDLLQSLFLRNLENSNPTGHEAASRNVRLESENKSLRDKLKKTSFTVGRYKRANKASRSGKSTK